MAVYRMVSDMLMRKVYLMWNTLWIYTALSPPLRNTDLRPVVVVEVVLMK